MNTKKLEVITIFLLIKNDFVKQLSILRDGSKTKTNFCSKINQKFYQDSMMRSPEIAGDLSQEISSTPGFINLKFLFY